MRQRADVEAALGGDLADLQRQMVVAALFGRHGEQREFARARKLGRQFAIENVGARAMPGFLQPENRPHRLSAVEIGAVGLRRFGVGNVDPGTTELRCRKLAIEAGAIERSLS